MAISSFAYRYSRVEISIAMVVLEKTAYGATILRGRTEEEWLIVPWWPCSGQTIRTIASAKLPPE